MHPIFTYIKHDSLIIEGLLLSWLTYDVAMMLIMMHFMMSIKISAHDAKSSRLNHIESIGRGNTAFEGGLLPP